MREYTITITVRATDEIGHPAVVEQDIADYIRSFDNVDAVNVEITNTTDAA